MFLEFFLMTILLFIVIVLITQFYYILFQGYAPYFSSKRKIIKKIINEIHIIDNAVVYELGCGNAGFLKSVEKKFPKIKKLIGTELFLFPYLIANIQLIFQKSKIKIIKKNYYNLHLGEADIVYCFLNKKEMIKLQDKFLRECKKRTQVISYQFKFPELQPIKVIDLDNNEKDKVYFYEM